MHFGYRSVIHMVNVDKIEIFSYTLLITGVIFDHITTSTGINQFDLLEANSMTRILMNNGYWGYTDILLSVILIFVIYKSYRVILIKENKFMFIFPIISGIIRLIAGTWNILLY